MTDHLDDAADAERAANLRQASDALLQGLDRLYELERRKRELMPGQAEFVRLAREIEDLARSVLHSSSAEVELAEEVHADVKRGDFTADLPIRETPPKRHAVEILAEWRAAERRLAAAPLGSTEEAAAHAEVDRFRAEYRDATAPSPPTDSGA